MNRALFYHLWVVTEYELFTFLSRGWPRLTQMSPDESAVISPPIVSRWCLKWQLPLWIRFMSFENYALHRCSSFCTTTPLPPRLPHPRWKALLFRFYRWQSFSAETLGHLWSYCCKVRQTLTLHQLYKAGFSCTLVSLLGVGKKKKRQGERKAGGEHRSNKERKKNG